MSDLHYFQRYTQKENVVTNNTLLLLSRLYSYSPLHFEAFLNDLVQTGNIEIGLRFKQQVQHAGKSVPDGLLIQPSLKVVIETKLNSEASLHQLQEHLHAFGREEKQVLLLLTPTQPALSFQEQLRRAVRDFNDQNSAGVVPICTTFEWIIRSYASTLAAHDYEMQEVLDDFRSFCTEAGLLPRAQYRMRAVPCGTTLEENFRWGIYYEPVDRSSQDHRYLGIYRNKQIQGVGDITNVVSAKLTDAGMEIEQSTVEVSLEQRQRIESMIRRAHAEHGWDITTDHKFFLVDQFYRTQFQKVSPGPMRGMQYFDLGELLGSDELPSTEGIAEQLTGVTW